MIVVYKNGTDISQNIVRGSIKIVEQLNNRASTATFKIFTTEVGYSTKIEMYEVVQLIAQASSGQAVLTVLDTYEDHEVFRAGDEIVLNIAGAMEYATILSINHTLKTVTLTANLGTTLAIGTICGRKIFAGTVEQNPNEEISSTGEFERSVNVAGRTPTLNRKNIADTYEDMHVREIVGRMIYDFCAHDTEEILESFEAAWTQSGVGSAMANEATDRIVGLYAQKTGTSGAGTGIWTKTLGAPVDITGMTDIRLWWKIKEDYGDNVSAMTIRVGNDSSNYLERSSTFIGSAEDDCWNRDNFKIVRGVETGSVDITLIDWLQIRVVCDAALPADGLLFDQMLATSGGFTLKNAIRGDRKITDYRANYKKASEVIDSLAKSLSIFWYVDYERDIHIFKQNNTPAPFDLTDTSLNYGDLVVEPDVSMLRNRQTVRGGEAPATVIYEQIHVADGQQTSRTLDYKPKDLTVEVDTGGGYVAKTVGVENLVDESTVNFVYNFQEKVLRNGNHATLGAGHKIKIQYYPYQSIRVRVSDNVSIAAMMALLGGDGIFDGPIIEDKNIASFEDARLRANAEITAYSNPIISVSFVTDKGGIHAGQIINIVDSSRSISDDFLVQRVSRSSYANGAESVYRVECGSTLFGLIEFFQLLLKKSTSITANDSEIVDIVQNVDETITFTDSITPTQKNKTVYAAAMLKNKRFDFVGMDGTRTATGRIVTSAWDRSWYAIFSGSAVGTVGFDTTSNYTSGVSLYIDVTTGGASQYILARLANMLPVKPATAYDFAVWLENLVADGLTGGSGLTIEIKEYADNIASSLLQTTAMLTNWNTKQEFGQITNDFTTHASTNYIDIVFTVNVSTGKVSISDILIQEQAAETVTDPGIASFSQAT